MRAQITVAGVAFAVIIPVAVESAIAYIKGESYSFPRAGLVFLAIFLVLLVLLLIRRVSAYPRTTIEVSTFTVGLVMIVANLIGIAEAQTRIEAYAASISLGSGILIAILSGFSYHITTKGADLLLATRSEVTAVETQRVGSGSGRHTVTVFTFSGFDEVWDVEVRDKCIEAVDVGDLHFVSYYVDGQCRFHVDCLEDASLNRFFRRISRESRRLIFERMGRQLDWIVERLGIYTKNLSEGILVRVVLDVEQGALYYCNVDSGAYLMGATLIQTEVMSADEKMRHLAHELGHLPRGDAPRNRPTPEPG